MENSSVCMRAPLRRPRGRETRGRFAKALGKVAPVLVRRHQECIGKSNISRTPISVGPELAVGIGTEAV